jgi:hypothetical protein
LEQDIECRCAQLLNHGGINEQYIKLQDLLSQIRRIKETSQAQTVERQETENAFQMHTLESLRSLIQKLVGRVPEETLVLGEYAITELLLDASMEMTQISAQRYAVSNVTALTADQIQEDKLRMRYDKAISHIRSALYTEQERRKRYPIAKEDRLHLHTLLHGYDQRIRRLSMYEYLSQEFADGLRSLEKMLEQYNLYAQVMAEREAEYCALYEVYVEVAHGLGMPIREKMTFADVSELRQELDRAGKMVERAEKCAQYYKKLGREGYLAMALDTEMRALGYGVYSRAEAVRKLSRDVVQAKAGDIAIPMYETGKDEPQGQMQLYHIDDTCSLQLVIHDDGTTTLQTVMEGTNPSGTVQAQHMHCRQMEQVRIRLLQNWFISFDPQQIADAYAVHSEAARKNRGHSEASSQKKHHMHQE